MKFKNFEGLVLTLRQNIFGDLRLIYNGFFSIIRLLLPVGKLFGGKTAAFVAGQESINYSLLKAWRNTQSKIIWFHCASLGEFEQGRPVLEGFREQHPDYGILLTFFSPSGYEVRKNYNKADFIGYLPLDTASNARKFIQAVQPNIVIFVKYEFWPNFIREINKAKAHLTGISVIFRPGQAFFKSWGAFFRKTLSYFDFFFVQNEDSARLLNSITFKNFEIVGDTRFDRVINTATQKIHIPGIEVFIAAKPDPEAEKKSWEGKVMVVGSAWKEDIEVLKPFIKNHQEMKFIIAPHEIHPEEINQWEEELDAVVFSKFENTTEKKVLIIDSIGLLSRLYKYADYAFVGGGFRTGLHNILEPAVFGIPIFFGERKFKKFQEALDLIEIGVAFPVKKNLDEVFAEIDTDWVREKAAAYVEKNSGATQKILAYLRTYA